MIRKKPWASRIRTLVECATNETLRDRAVRMVELAREFPVRRGIGDRAREAREEAILTQDGRGRGTSARMSGASEGLAEVWGSERLERSPQSRGNNARVIGDVETSSMP